MKNSRVFFFLSEKLHVLEVKFSIYSYRRVFVMNSFTGLTRIPANFKELGDLHNLIRTNVL